MKNRKVGNYDDFTDHYESYEERKGKIKRVSSEHRPRRQVQNWRKAWSEHTDDYDERDEFFGKNKNSR